MSLVKGEKCPVCQAYLFDEDDVVVCPECGAPHHRDCYNKIGKCALSEFHGTEQQYKKPIVEEVLDKQDNANSDQIVCGMCKQKYSAQRNICPNCGAVNAFKAGSGYFVFDFLGGIDANMDIGDGVTADEAKKFVVSNTHRFIPRFAQFKMGRKTSWNWLAFLFPGGWFLYRKMYWLGAIISALSVAASMFVSPLSNMLYQLGYDGQVATLYQYDISTFGAGVLAAAVIGAVLTGAIRIFSGFFADRLYRNHVIKKISEIKAKSEDVEFDFRRKGGVSFILLVVGLLVVNYLPSIIVALFGI